MLKDFNYFNGYLKTTRELFCATLCTADECNAVEFKESVSIFNSLLTLSYRAHPFTYIINDTVDQIN